VRWLLQMPEFLEAVVKMLDSALPDDWPTLERGLRAALALASTSPQVSVNIGQSSCLVQGPCKVQS
jgi:hypothetical protein